MGNMVYWRVGFHVVGLLPSHITTRPMRLVIVKGQYTTLIRSLQCIIDYDSLYMAVRPVVNHIFCM